MKKVQRGFSLLEGLISLFFFLLIILFSLECFISVKGHFTMLKESETSNTAVYAALDRIRRDLQDAGLGLTQAMALLVLEGISENQETLVILSKVKNLAVEEALVSGQQRIPTADATDVKRGQFVCVINPYGGEVHSVVAANRQSIVIQSPLTSSYIQDNTAVVLLRRISLFLDETDGVIRRKVNASPAQPLLEDVAGFEFDYVKKANLIRLGIVLISEKERIYETAVFPKNTAMVSIPWE